MTYNVKCTYYVVINVLIFKQEPKKTGPNFKITKGVSTKITFRRFQRLELVWTRILMTIYFIFETELHPKIPPL